MANKFLDATGVAHVWEKMKAYSAEFTVPAAVNLANQTSASNLLTAKAYTDEQFSKLLGGATAEELDTLKELSDALNDDKNFASTMTNAIANKQPLNENLTAIGGLTGTGLLKKTGTKTWTLDTNTYLTSITKSMVTTALGYTPINPDVGGTISGSLHVNDVLSASSVTADDIEVSGGSFTISDVTVSAISSGGGTLATENWVTGRGYLTKTTADATYLGISAKAASATVADSANSVAWSKISGIPSTFTPPTATSSTLGGVKIGSNITITSGTISLTKGNVTAALGYTPVDSSGGSISGDLSVSGVLSAGSVTTGTLTADDIEITSGTIYKVYYDNDGTVSDTDEYVVWSTVNSIFARKTDLAIALTNEEISTAIGY